MARKSNIVRTNLLGLPRNTDAQGKKVNWKKQVLQYIGGNRITLDEAREYGFDNVNDTYSGIWYIIKQTREDVKANRLLKVNIKKGTKSAILKARDERLSQNILEKREWIYNTEDRLGRRIAITADFKVVKKSNLSDNITDVGDFLNNNINKIRRTVRDALFKLGGSIRALCVIEWKKDMNEELYTTTGFYTIGSVSQIENFIDYIIERQTEMSINMLQYDVFISGITLKFTRNQPLRGGSYIDLPKWISNKNACVNIKNNDNECFKWCLLGILHVQNKDPQRVSKYYQYVNSINEPEDVEYPVKIKDIHKWEECNPNISINVFYPTDDNQLMIAYRTKNYNTDCIPVDLLLINQKEEVKDTELLKNYKHKDIKIINNHYVIIRKLHTFLTTKCKNHVSCCRHCLKTFNDNNKRDEHFKTCRAIYDSDNIIYEMPKENTILKFDKFKAKQEVPFVIYADFESYNSKNVSNTWFSPRATDVRTGDKSRITTLTTHNFASGWFYVSVIDDVKHLINSNITKPQIFYNVKDFMDGLKNTVNELVEVLKININYDIDEANKHKNIFEKSHNYKCHICENVIDRSIKTVVDHDHLTGKVRGITCDECNKHYWLPKKIPVVIHNFRGYDSHFIIQALTNEDDVSVIAQNTEKITSMTINRNCQFVDSCQHLLSSLDGLVQNLSDEDFKHIKEHFKDKYIHMIKKGIFPYEWFDSPDKMNEIKLPHKQYFYSVLSGHITNEEYERALFIWKEFDCKTFKDYHDLYLITDVLLLADVFDAYRRTSFKSYTLDPVHFLTSPSLAWNAMLYKTKVNLELLTDIDMYRFFKAGIRGGVSMISHRYAKANNKEMKNDYDPNKESSYIWYLDANNLYGGAMSQNLPIGEFEWVENPTIDLLNEAGGVTLEVDLEYPDHLHHLHNDYPLAPETLHSKYYKPMLSQYNKNIGDLTKTLDIGKKLIPNLMNKNNYIVHHEALRFYIKHGLKVTKVHRAIRYKEKDFLKEYIDLNTSMRTKTNKDFEKDFYKLMNNAVFGKTMENVENRMELDIVSNDQRLQKCVNKPHLKNFKTIFNNITMVQYHKCRVRLNKPIYIGQSILDISKIHMYKFHYEYMKPKYGDDAKLLFTDTDSLCYHVKSEDVYKENDLNGWFDTSECVRDDIPKLNKKKLGFMKDESNGIPITEFVGLKPKVYAYKLHGGVENKKCKGVKKSVVKKEIAFNDYKDILFNIKSVLTREISMIRSKNHKVHTLIQNKKALSAYDSKRYILGDGITSLAYGHRDLKL